MVQTVARRVISSGYHGADRIFREPRVLGGVPALDGVVGVGWDDSCVFERRERSLIRLVNRSIRQNRQL